ncbi:MAG: fumarylacetoacetate hydrolase family protein [Bryobacterales bacterium]|nr:fumarylacetoacetate hydrolase family protein [Bryobacterales bacterium]
MGHNRRTFLQSAGASSLLSGAISSAASAQTKPSATKPGSAQVQHFVRIAHGGARHYGLLEGEQVRILAGGLFGNHRPTGQVVPLKDAKLFVPCEPKQVIACGLNYRSHLAGAPVPTRPEIFFKSISCLQNPGDPILIPPGAKNVHFEAEIVIVVGKPVRNATRAQAEAAIFGVTCGNDVSERDWQGGPDKDLQWWRAKGAATFGPLGPSIARGVNYGNLLVQMRLNGKVMQKQYTSDLIFDLPAILMHVSKYMDVYPGDVIYTGTPGSTSAMKPGDIAEVDIEGIGILRNPVKAG